MPRYIIERELPGAGKLSAAELKAIARKSCAVLDKLGPKIQAGNEATLAQHDIDHEKSSAHTGRLSCVPCSRDEPSPCPLPFTKGEGSLRGHRVRVTERESESGSF